MGKPNKPARDTQGAAPPSAGLDNNATNPPQPRGEYRDAPPMQVPTVGRAVYYYQNPTQPYPLAGTIAFVHTETTINLGFLSGNGVASYATSVAYSETPTSGSRWCWPPRV
jgi:hypothetical protein